MNIRLDSSEYAPYFFRYISIVPSGELLTILENQRKETVSLLRGLPEESGLYRYEKDKWSLKEVVGHFIDTERIMSYRALRIARGDLTTLPGFNQDTYVSHANFDRFSIEELLSEFDIVRQATLSLFSGFTEQCWLRRGTINNYEITVRAIGFVIAGHELHHRTVIQERYLSLEGK